MTDDGELKVLDFGIARLRDPAGAAAASVTRTGSMLGTPAYMPPEQVLGRSREIDGQTDIWSVGATMFAVMSGHYVHDAETVEELLVYAGSRPARLLGSVAPDIAPALAAVVDRALAFDKAGRWPDARAMQGAIQEASARAFGTSVSSACPMQLAATIPAPVPCPLVPTQIAAPHTGSTTAVVVETPHRSGAPRRIMRMGLSAALIVLLAIGADVVVVANGGGRVSPSSRGTEPTSLAPPATSADMAAPSAAPVVASAALDPIAAPIAVGELPPAATVPRRAPLHGPTLRQQPTRREPPSRSRW